MVKIISSRSFSANVDLPQPDGPLTRCRVILRNRLLLLQIVFRQTFYHSYVILCQKGIRQDFRLVVLAVHRIIPEGSSPSIPILLAFGDIHSNCRHLLNHVITDVKVALTMH